MKVDAPVFCLLIVLFIDIFGLQRDYLGRLQNVMNDRADLPEFRHLLGPAIDEMMNVDGMCYIYCSLLGWNGITNVTVTVGLL